MSEVLKVDKPKYLTPTGSRFVKRYESRYDEDLGREVVVETDDFDIYEFIQASNNLTDLSMLREQMIRTGEIPQLDPSAQYGQDTSLLPSNIHELYDTVNHAQDVFNSLPDDVKGAFKNDPNIFLSELVNGSYMATAAKHLTALEEAKLKEKEGTPNE